MAKGVNFLPQDPKISGLNPKSFDSPPKNWQNCRLKPTSLTPLEAPRPRFPGNILIVYIFIDHQGCVCIPDYTLRILYKKSQCNKLD